MISLPGLERLILFTNQGNMLRMLGTHAILVTIWSIWRFVWMLAWLVGCIEDLIQPYRDLEAGDYQTLKFKWRGGESNPGPLAPQAKSLTTRPPPLPWMVGIRYHININVTYVTCSVCSVRWFILFHLSLTLTSLWFKIVKQFSSAFSHCFCKGFRKLSCVQLRLQTVFVLFL